MKDKPMEYGFFDGNAALAMTFDDTWPAARTAVAGGGRERRRFVRHQVNLPIRELHPEWHVLRATAISAGGLFCPNASPRPLGSKMLLEVYLLDRERPLMVAARVAHVGRGPSGLGVGLEFTNPQPELANYLAKSNAAEV